MKLTRPRFSTTMSSWLWGWNTQQPVNPVTMFIWLWLKHTTTSQPCPNSRSSANHSTFILLSSKLNEVPQLMTVLVVQWYLLWSYSDICWGCTVIPVVVVQWYMLWLYSDICCGCTVISVVVVQWYLLWLYSDICCGCTVISVVLVQWYLLCLHSDIYLTLYQTAGLCLPEISQPNRTVSQQCLPLLSQFKCHSWQFTPSL